MDLQATKSGLIEAQRILSDVEGLFCQAFRKGRECAMNWFKGLFGLMSVMKDVIIDRIDKGLGV